MNTVNLKDPIAPTSIQRIAKKAWAFHLLISRLTEHLKKYPSQDLELERELASATQYLQFYIDKPALERINKNIATLPDFDLLGGFFGIDDQHDNKLTTCFVGLDKYGQILEGHFPSKQEEKYDPIDGEETWPPPPLPPPPPVVGGGVGESTCLSLDTTPERFAEYFRLKKK